jgi:hypothetical protein
MTALLRGRIRKGSLVSVSMQTLLGSHVMAKVCAAAGVAPNVNGITINAASNDKPRPTS